MTIGALENICKADTNFREDLLPKDGFSVEEKVFPVEKLLAAKANNHAYYCRTLTFKKVFFIGCNDGSKNGKK